MRAFFQIAQLLLADMASSLLYLILFSITHNIVISVFAGVLLGVTQILVQFARQKQIDVMEWLSLFVVVASGAATLIFKDPRFVLVKPSAIYAIAFVVMIKPGWMNRYLPAIARIVAADIATYVGFAWAGLMLISAVLNVWLALNTDMATWGVAMTAFGITSKSLLAVVGYLAIRLTTRRRLQAMPAGERQLLLTTTGWTA